MAEPSLPIADIAKATMTVLTPLFTGAWFLIKRWGAMAEKVKRAEAAKVMTTIDALKAELTDTRRQSLSIMQVLSKTREELIAVKTKLEASANVGERIVTQVDRFHHDTEARVHLMEASLGDGEILRIGQTNRFMFKGRRKED